jgi:hypothetical protein
MRRIVLTVMFVALSWLYAAAPTGTVPAPTVAIAADDAPAAAPDAAKAPTVDVNVNRTERHVISFTDPKVLAIGAGAVVLILALFALASRGGGTTIVREK